ncbi:MAG: hypothetical protein ACD_67C00046G0001 [uncultured bacterium]|nr:MAG: hypothetical protein ACD_67C00046G0001 [uncultured bacterium]
MTKPHVISFMSVAATPELRMQEFKKFLQLFLIYLPDFRAPVALTINVSCPNTKNAPKELAYEALSMVQEAQILNIPVGVKFGPEVEAQTIMEIDKSGICDYVVLCNTLKVGNYAKNFSWRWAFGWKSFAWSLFGKVYSPLEKFGGGGYSGPKLRPVVRDLIKEVRAKGAKITIIACGGIQKPKHVIEMLDAGANAVKIGTVAMLRFWRISSIKKTAYEVF